MLLLNLLEDTGGRTMLLPELLFLQLKQVLHSVSKLLFLFVSDLESDCDSVETQVLLKTT